MGIFFHLQPKGEEKVMAEWKVKERRGWVWAVEDYTNFNWLYEFKELFFPLQSIIHQVRVKNVLFACFLTNFLSSRAISEDGILIDKDMITTM